MKKLSPLWPYLRRYKRALATGVAAVFASAMIGMASPVVIGRAVDALKSHVSLRTLATYSALLLGVVTLRGLFTYLQRMILVRMSRDVERDLVTDYFAHLERLPPAFFQARQTGDLMARATSDVAAVRMVSGPAIMYGANTVFSGLGSLAFMLSIHAGLTGVALASMPFVALITRGFGRRIHALFTQVQERFASLTSRVQEHLSGVRVVRAYARELSEERAFDEVNRANVEINRRLIRWNAAFSPLIEALIGCGYVTVLAYGGLLVRRDAISVGEFVTFTFFLGRLVWPMVAVGWVMNMVERASASLKRIREIMDVEPAIADLPAAAAPLPAAMRGGIRIENLDFAYEGGPPVLSGIALDAPAGSTVAIVGHTGSGKSTLLSLLPRLFDPPPGRVAIDGRDVRSWPLAELRGGIGMVPQETFLFSSTLCENIALGRPEATVEEVAAAAENAGLGEDIAGFPQGLDTVVGERGITLSGGQKQRVALARALLREPAILLLDDCLSAVDTATEERILGNLRQQAKGRTVMLVSHRVSTVKGADQILVLEHGAIAERGKHDELVAKGGLYADLERRQQLEEELAVV